MRMGFRALAFGQHHSTGSSIWTPASINGINTWFDNDLAYITKDGSNQVTEWRDKVPASTKKYTQANASLAPVYDAAKKALIFDGSKYMSRSTNLSGVTNITYFYVFRYTGLDNAGSQQIINGHNGVGGQITTNLKAFSGLKKTTIQLQAGGTTLQTAVIDYAKISSDYILYMVNYVAGGTSKITVFDIGSPHVEASGVAGTRTFSANDMYLGCSYLQTFFLTAEWKMMASVLGTPSQDTVDKMLEYCKKNYSAAK